MNPICRLSDNTKRYLEHFYCILDEMTAAMTGAELTESISYDFIIQMIPHHRAAVEMSENLLQYTTFLPLQDIAQNIIQEQTESIKQMQAALPCCSQLCNCIQDQYLYSRRTEQIMDTMFTEMGDADETNCSNSNFLREMIPHHRGAIRMSENALHYSICPELLPILEAIICSQKKGVREMEHLLRCIR